MIRSVNPLAQEPRYELIGRVLRAINRPGQDVDQLVDLSPVVADNREIGMDYDDGRWSGYYWQPQYRYRAPVRYVYPRGYAPYQWRVGHRLPRHYYERHYYVDYRAYRLPPPPYGYHWVRVDRDVVLVAIGTGLILDVFYGLFH